MEGTSTTSSLGRTSDSEPISGGPRGGPSDSSGLVRPTLEAGGAGEADGLKSALLIVDVSNLYYCVKKQYGEDKRLDYERFTASVMQSGVDLRKAIAYGAEMNEAAAKFKTVLQRLGFETKYKQPKIYANEGKETRKADWDVGMAMDVVRLAKDYDVIIFATADGDLAPCVDYIREVYPEKECWVVACGVSRELKISAHLWREIVREEVE